jgi:hypothetical protein
MLAEELLADAIERADALAGGASGKVGGESVSVVIERA